MSKSCVAFTMVFIDNEITIFNEISILQCFSNVWALNNQMHQAGKEKYVDMSNTEAEEFCVIKADLFLHTAIFWGIFHDHSYKSHPNSPWKWRVFFLTRPKELDLQSSSTWFLALAIESKKFLTAEFFEGLFVWDWNFW